MLSHLVVTDSGPFWCLIWCQVLVIFEFVQGKFTVMVLALVPEFNEMVYWNLENYEMQTRTTSRQPQRSLFFITPSQNQPLSFVLCEKSKQLRLIQDVLRFGSHKNDLFLQKWWKLVVITLYNFIGINLTQFV